MKSAFSSLRARLAILVLVTILPALGLSIYSNLEQRRLAGEHAGEEALRLVRVVAGNHEEIVEGTRQLLIALAQLEEVRGDDRSACSTLLGRIRDQNRRYANLGVIGADGVTFCSALPYDGPLYLGDRTYFQEALAGGGFRPGEYQVGRITERPSINFGYPILGEGGNALGIVFAALDLAWLNGLAAGLELEDGVVLFTMDRQGSILSRYPDGEQWIGQTPPEAPLLDVILTGGGEGTAQAEGLDNVSRLYAFAPLEDEGLASVYVVAGIPTTVAYAEANRNLTRNLAGLGMLTVLFVAVAWAFTEHFVLRRVQALVRAAGRFAGGDLSARSELGYGAGELGQLARSFDEMALALESRLRRLQALNAIDRAITSRYELRQTLDVVLEQVAGRLDVDASSILLLNEESGVLEFAAWRGFRSAAVRDARLAPGEGLSGRVALERRPLTVSNLRESEEMDAPRSETGLLAAEDFASYCGVPLIAEDELLGVLSVYKRTALHIEEEWMVFLEALALQAAIAIDNARLVRESRRLLERTQAQARQVQQIVDTLPEGVLLLDSEQRVLLANPLAERYLSQLEAVAAVAAAAEDAADAAAAAGTAAAADAAVAAGAAAGARASSGVAGTVLEKLGDRKLDGLLQPVGEDEPWHELTAPGEKQVFEAASRPVRYEGDVDGWVLVLRNVTEERERQEYMQTQERLATVGQLAAGIAHDFNNIMAVITLYGEALGRSPDHPRRMEYLKTITDQAQRAATLIAQILDFSRAGAVKRVQLDLPGFVQEVTGLLRRTVPETITITLVYGSDDYIVEADATRLQQVLMNLAVNARDAMPDGGQLTIALSSQTVADDEGRPLPDMEPGRYICLAVSDTGSGIPAEALPRIFEPFFTTKPRGAGTGLGLAQVYGIVKHHQGAVDVESKMGEGTTFRIYLPAAREAEKAVVAAREESRPAVAARGTGAMTILLVEDNPATRMAIQDTLEELGYRVLEAENGQDALAVLQEHAGSVDLVLSDIVMPEMDGIVLQQKLQETYPDVALLLMSGYPLQAEAGSPAMAGPTSWLGKPFTADELERAVARVLGVKE